MFMNVRTTDYQTKDSIPPDEALAEALVRMRPALTSRARTIVGNRSDAEDAVQEAAVRAWRSRWRFRSGTDPAPWLQTIVTRAALDLTRARARHRDAAIDERVLLGPSAEESMMRAEVLATIEAAAARLGPSSRRVLLLHDVAGYTSYEIAQLDNLPYHTVRTRLRRARISLRNELKEAI
jgi:RNA polymerase sigma-70 factor, ECF subfamily